MVNVAVLGYGTVGSGVVEVLSRNADVLKKVQDRKLISSTFLILKNFREHRLKTRLFMTLTLFSMTMMFQLLSR